jgi:hypothetical protein
MICEINGTRYVSVDIGYVYCIIYEAFTQCCGPGSGIRCLFDPWIRDPGWVKSQHPDPR